MPEFEVACGVRVVAVYADGGVIQQNPSPHGGTWAYCWVDDQGHRIREESGLWLCQDHDWPVVTNNQTELLAIGKALASLPKGSEVTVCSDSRIALGWVFWDYDPRSAPAGWVEHAKRYRGRLGGYRVILHQGHPTRADLAAGVGKKRGLPVSEHQVWCHEACQERAREFLKSLERERLFA